MGVDNGVQHRSPRETEATISSQIPSDLLELVDRGVLDAVVCPLKSGKEADLFVVECDQLHYVAKVYKERRLRSFKNDCNYKEGRSVRSSRARRALSKNSKYGRKIAETAWHNAEVDALRLLQQAGVRVPHVHSHHERVVIMEMICDKQGQIAPQLAQVSLSRAQAQVMVDKILDQVVLLLCNDLIHGDLSPYNVLVRDGEPVVIDLPQCVSAAHNMQAARMLERDVTAITQYLGLVEPSILALSKHAWQLWDEYERGTLAPGFRLDPKRKRSSKVEDLGALVDLVRSTRDEQMLERRAKNGDVEARALLKAAERRASRWARKEAEAAEAAREEAKVLARKNQPKNKAKPAGGKKRRGRNAGRRGGVQQKHPTGSATKDTRSTRRGRNDSKPSPTSTAPANTGRKPPRRRGKRRGKGGNSGQGASQARAASLG